MPYGEAQIATALEVVKRAGGLTVDAVRDIRAALHNPKLPKSTIWRWLQNDATEQKRATPEAKQAASKALDEMFEQVARNYLDHATKPDVIAEVDGKAAVTAAAIAVDKMRLLRDLPTEIIQSVGELTELANFFRENGIDMSPAIRDWRERLKAKKEAQGNVSNG